MNNPNPTEQELISIVPELEPYPYETRAYKPAQPDLEIIAEMDTLAQCQLVGKYQDSDFERAEKIRLDSLVVMGVANHIHGEIARLEDDPLRHEFFDALTPDFYRNIEIYFLNKARAERRSSYIANIILTVAVDIAEQHDENHRRLT